MRERVWTCAGALIVVLACTSGVTGPIAREKLEGLPAVSARSADPRAPIPRTRDGKPDLQGFWNSATLTPLERPRTGEGKTTMSAKEADEIEKSAAARREYASRPSDPGRSAPPVGGDGSTGAAGGVGGYNAFWIDIGTQVTQVNGEARTSLIVDPPEGRVPPFTPEALQKFEARRDRLMRPTSDAGENAGGARAGAYDDVELRPLGERCLMGFGSTAGPPALPVMYNNIKQIVQTPEHVLILNEMVHDARIVRMNGTHLPPVIRRWMGDSIGRWEGDTLVVETTNFSDKTRFRGSSENLKVTERFRRVDDKTLLYQFTVEDPTTWTRSWSGEYTWAWSDQPIYEYACHEGNYALEDILKGARLDDAERVQTPKKKPSK
jgi:hypothetical protein